MERIEVLKTYKLYIGGKFPRTESGRYYKLEQKGNLLANVCLSSRKDFRNAVVAAGKAQGGWSGKSAFNRSQILYRIGEVLEGRKAQFIEELVSQGMKKAAAEKEVLASVDRLIYYAGWCDKYQQMFSSVNPVASPHFNFSALEPVGTVAAIAPEGSGLLGLVSAIAPVIAGGNSIVILASESMPLSAITLSEVINDSDVPGGVINVLTGNAKELATHMATHMDVHALLYCGEDADLIKQMQLESVDNLKRFRNYSEKDVLSTASPYQIEDFQEVKTTWHPIERIGGASSSY